MINRLFIDQNTGCGKGNYSSMTMRVNFELERMNDYDPAKPNQPTHQIYLVAMGGGLVPGGAVWTKQVETGANKGMRFFSMSFDDPSFDKPLNLTAFRLGNVPPDKNQPVEYEVVWRRPSATQAA